MRNKHPPHAFPSRLRSPNKVSFLSFLFFYVPFLLAGDIFFRRINGIYFDVNTNLNTSSRLNWLAKIWSVAEKWCKVAGNQSIRQTNSHSLWPQWDNFCLSCFVPILALLYCVLSIQGNMVLTLPTSASKLSLSTGMKKFPDWYVLGNCSSNGVKKELWSVRQPSCPHETFRSLLAHTFT